MVWHLVSLAGLALIAFGWFYQYRSLSPKSRTLSPVLPLANLFGIALLVLDAVWTGLGDVALFNLLTLAGAALTFMAVSRPAGRTRPRKLKR